MKLETKVQKKRNSKIYYSLKQSLTYAQQGTYTWSLTRRLNPVYVKSKNIYSISNVNPSNIEGIFPETESHWVT